MISDSLYSEMAMAISYNWLFLWDTFYKWGDPSTYNWFFTWAITVSLSILITSSPAVSSEESGLSERLDGSPGERWTLDAARRLGHVAEQWLMISSGIRPPNTWGLDSQRKKNGR